MGPFVNDCSVNYDSIMNYGSVKQINIVFSSRVISLVRSFSRLLFNNAPIHNVTTNAVFLDHIIWLSVTC